MSILCTSLPLSRHEMGDTAEKENAGADGTEDEDDSQSASDSEEELAVPPGKGKIVRKRAQPNQNAKRLMMTDEISRRLASTMNAHMNTCGRFALTKGNHNKTKAIKSLCDLLNADSILKSIRGSLLFRPRSLKAWLPAAMQQAEEDMKILQAAAALGGDRRSGDNTPLLPPHREEWVEVYKLFHGHHQAELNAPAEAPQLTLKSSGGLLKEFDKMTGGNLRENAAKQVNQLREEELSAGSTGPSSAKKPKKASALTVIEEASGMTGVMKEFMHVYTARAEGQRRSELLSEMKQLQAMIQQGGDEEVVASLRESLAKVAKQYNTAV